MNDKTPLTNRHRQKQAEISERKTMKKETEVTADGTSTLTKSRRVRKYSNSHCGKLVNMLRDESWRRGTSLKKMASELGITYGYLSHLSNGTRSVKSISLNFTLACARYLSVQPIVIKLASGQIEFSDFIHPSETEEAAVERAVRRLQHDPKYQQVIPGDMNALSIEAKKAILMLYAQASTVGIVGLNELPKLLQGLQQLTTLFDKPEPRNSPEQKVFHKAGSSNPLQSRWVLPAHL